MEQHQVWQGDWGARVSALVAPANITEFVQAHPRATIHELAARLGLDNVAPFQLLRLLSDEAHARRNLQDFARDMLVRYLNELPNGWMLDSSTWRAVDAVTDQLIAWQGCLFEREDVLERISDALLDDREIPRGWRPEDANDPFIIRAFQAHWPMYLC